MNVLLLDIWQDLREKRLLPVAALLLAGLVAVPLFLGKSAPQESSSAPSSTAAVKPIELPVVQALDDAGIKGSDLKVFDAKNPFTPRIKRRRLSARDVTTVSTLLDQGTGSTGGGTPSTGGDTGTPTPLPTPTPTPTPAPAPQRKRSYTYVVDVTFRGDGRTRHIEGLSRFEMLPNETKPLAVFLGVDSGASNAVFLLDSTVQQAGEGSCKPSARACDFLLLGSGSEHTLADAEGTEYTIRIDQIRKVSVKRAVRAAKARARAAVSGKGDVQADTRRFVLPLTFDDIQTND